MVFPVFLFAAAAAATATENERRTKFGCDFSSCRSSLFHRLPFSDSVGSPLASINALHAILEFGSVRRRSALRE